MITMVQGTSPIENFQLTHTATHNILPSKIIPPPPPLQTRIAMAKNQRIR